jgi:hypothetical protein
MPRKLNVSYLETIPISGFHSSGDYLAVAFGGEPLETHQTACVIHNVVIGSFHGDFPIRKISVHRFEKSRVIASRFQILSYAFRSSKVSQMNVSNSGLAESLRQSSFGKARFS